MVEVIEALVETLTELKSKALGNTLANRLAEVDDETHGNKLAK